MIQPALSDQRFLEDVRAAAYLPGSLHLWWLGQSGFLVQSEGRHLLLDPYLSDSLTRKYESTDKPHVRMTARVVDPAELGFVDVITSSHNHTDHLDADTVRPILEGRPQIVMVVPRANQEFAAARLQVDASRLTPIDAGDAVLAAGFTLHALPSAHEQVETDESGHHRYLGYVVECGPWRLYHSGDTVRYDGMAARLRPWNLDVALLPINGRASERRVAGNLSGQEAAELAHDIGARLVIPCHYDMFEFNTAPPDEFVAACKRREQPYRVLRCGERSTLSARNGK